MKSPLATIDVLILAGGLGSRLAGVLGETPKVLAPIHGRPFLDYLLDRLAGQGVSRVVLSLGHLAEKVRIHLERHEAPLTVETVVEPRPLGTAGAIAFAHSALTSDPILVLNGDTWLELDPAVMLATHRRSPEPLATIACVRVDDPRRYGIVEIDPDGVIRRFAEKDQGSAAGAIVNGGAYLLSLRLRDSLSEASGSFERDVLTHLPPRSLRAHLVEGANFVDIGTPESYAQAAAALSAPMPRSAAGGQS